MGRSALLVMFSGLVGLGAVLVSWVTVEEARSSEKLAVDELEIYKTRELLMKTENDNLLEELERTLEELTESSDEWQTIVTGQKELIKDMRERHKQNVDLLKANNHEIKEDFDELVRLVKEVQKKAQSKPTPQTGTLPE